VLFEIAFTATKSGRVSEMIDLSDQVVRTEAYQLTATKELEEINISINAETGADDIMEEFALYQRLTTIKVASILDTEGTLTVKDALGKLIVSKDVSLVKGPNELVLTKDDIPVGGVYYYTLTIGDVQISKQMIRMD